jgi:hypothetical protein
LISQTASIEAGVDPVDHAEIQFPDLMYVDTSSDQWASNVTYFSMDYEGQAQWFAAAAQDMPYAESSRAKHEVPIHMAGIGYTYNLEELMQAMMVPGLSLTSDRASAAREAANRFVETVAKTGDTTKTWQGLYNQTGPGTTGAASAWVGANGRLNSGITAAIILSETNAILNLVFADTQISFFADTLLLPPAVFGALASTPRSDTSDTTLLEYIRMANVYTASTNMPLTIKAGIGLNSIDSGKAIAYQNHPKVVRLHYPMMHQFLEPYQIGPVIFSVPGILRIGGVEVKRNKAMRYLTGLLS